MKLIRASTVPTSLEDFCKGFLKELSADYEVVALSSPGEELKIIEKREGVKCIAVPMKRRISIWEDFKSLVKIIRVLNKEHPTIVHSITPKAGLLCMVAAWCAHVPLRVHTFTGLVFPTSVGFKRKVLMLTDWLTCRCATHIIPEGEGVKNDLINYGITKKPIRVLGNGNIKGVDLIYYDRTAEVLEKAKVIVNKNVFTFVFVGRIVQDKGINELLETAMRLEFENSNFRILLVGDFEDTSDFISPKCKSYILNSKTVTFCGFQSDVRPWLAASDALVLPSYREGFPNVVLEAGALGIPSIVTNINGSREIIKEEVNGVIIPPRDTNALYGAMKYFIENPKKVSEMGANCRKIIAEKYEQRFVWQCQRDFYREILEEIIDSR